MDIVGRRRTESSPVPPDRQKAGAVIGRVIGRRPVEGQEDKAGDRIDQDFADILTALDAAEATDPQQHTARRVDEAPEAGVIRGPRAQSVGHQLTPAERAATIGSPEWQQTHLNQQVPGEGIFTAPPWKSDLFPASNPAAPAALPPVVRRLGEQ